MFVNNAMRAGAITLVQLEKKSSKLILVVLRRNRLSTKNTA
jgi:hypothetical protein